MAMLNNTVAHCN